VTFRNRLAAAWAASDSLLCVGLDPDPARFPDHVGKDSRSIEFFCDVIVD
jgi:orotidine-5'-phosphate decarboxylase